MTMYMLPRKAKDILAEKWSKYNFKEYQKNTDALIKFMYSKQPSDEQIRDNYKRFTILDKYREESTVDLMDEICPELKEYFYD